MPAVAKKEKEKNKSIPNGHIFYAAQKFAFIGQYSKKEGHKSTPRARNSMHLRSSTANRRCGLVLIVIGLISQRKLCARLVEQRVYRFGAPIYLNAKSQTKECKLMKIFITFTASMRSDWAPISAPWRSQLTT